MNPVILRVCLYRVLYLYQWWVALFLQRFQLMDTSSFRELDAGWRDRLAWLHDDYFYRRQVGSRPPNLPPLTLQYHWLTLWRAGTHVHELPHPTMPDDHQPAHPILPCLLDMWTLLSAA